MVSGNNYNVFGSIVALVRQIKLNLTSHCSAGDLISFHYGYDIESVFDRRLPSS